MCCSELSPPTHPLIIQFSNSITSKFSFVNFGKIVICGRISQMNATSPGEGLKNMAHVLVKRLTIKGFLIFDHYDDSKIIIVSLIDNLIKGAAGQAVQCFNLSQGFDESSALTK